MVGEITAMDWARTVGKPNAFFRSPFTLPDGAGIPGAGVAVDVVIALTVPLVSTKEIAVDSLRFNFDERRGEYKSCRVKRY